MFPLQPQGAHPWLPFLVGAASLVLLLTLPMWASRHLLGMAILIGIYTVVVVGLSLLMGYGGQISLAQAAFFGIGGYTSGILSTRFGWSPWLALVAGMILAAIVAYGVGIPTLRLREQYLALGTAGVGIVFWILFSEWTGLTGGPSGLAGIPYLSLGGYLLKNDTRFYYLVLAVAALVMWLAHNIVASRIGRGLRALHTSEVAAECMGVDTARLKLQIFVLSAVLASLAGSLYAHYVTFISPVLFSFSESIHFAMMAVVGGAASIWGAPLGAALMTMLTEAVRSALPVVFPQAGGEVEMVFFGLLLVMLMIYMPDGLALGIPGRLKGVIRRGAAHGAGS